MSTEARAWLEAALDPFHDYQLAHVAGFPDVYSQPSVVQLITKNLTISKPAALTAPWDANVFYTGLSTLGHSPMVSSTSNDLVQYNHAAIPATASSSVSSVAVMCANSGGQMNLADAYYHIGDVNDTDIPYRVVASGMEIHNDTAPINKQGSLTVGILEPFARDVASVPYFDTNASPYSTVDVQSDRLRGIPTSSTSLRSVPSARTWAAKDGCYIVPRMMDQATMSLKNRRDATLTFITPAGVETAFHSFPGGVTPVTGADSKYRPVFNSPIVTGFTPMMISLTGLSAETTFTITLKTIVEMYPPPTHVLAPMATPSCPFSPNALSAYSAISSSAPYAVPVGENAAGDFFRKVISAAKYVVPLISTGINTFIPGAGTALLPFANTMLNWGKHAVDKKWPQKPQNNKQASAAAVPMAPGGSTTQVTIAPQQAKKLRIRRPPGYNPGKR